jgi:hypothetical protein
MKHVVLSLTVCAAFGLCGLLPAVRGDEPAKDKPKPDAAKELAALQKEWNDAELAFSKAYQEAKTDEEKQQVLKEKRPKAADYADRFLKIAETDPDSLEAVSAFGWLLRHGGGTEEGGKARVKIPMLKEKLAAITDLDELSKKLAVLPPRYFMDATPQFAEKAKKNLDHPQAVPILIWVCSATLYSDGTPLAKLYDSTIDLLMERFPERKELAPLAMWLPMDQRHPEWAEKHLRKLTEKSSDGFTKMNGKFGLATILVKKDEESQPEAEKLFQSFVDGPDKNPLFADRAKEELAEMKVRGIGKPVPDIAGDDLDSKSFKLSDYKGKVILLDFWAFW